MNTKIDLGDNRLSFALLLMAVAYVFSMGVRMIWINQMGGVDVYHWNGQLMINTNDGYYFGAAAQKALEGLHQFNPRLPDWLSSGVVFFTVLFTKYTPFSLDTVMLYLPGIIASLVVIPVILIGRLYGSALFGFFAALIGSIAWSYYNRTMMGYYDTDMFSAMMPMFILYFLLAMLETEKRVYMLLASLTIMFYPFLYDSGLSLVYAMGMLYMGYMLLFHRKERYTYESIILVAVALMGLPLLLKLILIVGLFALFAKVELEYKGLYVAAAASVLLFLFTGNVFSLVWAKVSTYLIRGVDESGGLKFYEVAQTVREAGQIPFETMANRISGSIPGVIAALAGYIILVIRNRGFILALPLIGIGVFSLWGGLRFTVYAVPVAALSVVYLFYFIAVYLDSRWARIALTAGLTGAMLYPNITHIIDYKVPTVFNKLEVDSLDKLSKVGTQKDYVLAWWDYGYPLWYYSNKNTLIDGGKHNHDNFLVSQMLLGDSQLEAARLSRIAVETYVDSNYTIVSDTLFKNGEPDQVDVNAYLETLRFGSPEIPAPTRDVYWFLPLKMLGILPTIGMFSNLDLNTGQRYADHFFYQTRRFRDTGETFDLANGVVVLKRSGVVRIGSEEIPLKALYSVGFTSNGQKSIKTTPLHADGRLSLIYLPSYESWLLADDYFLNSNFIQMFIFDKYDADLFEPVEITPWVKIYRLKI